MKTKRITLTVVAALVGIVTALPAAAQTRTGIQVDARIQTRPQPAGDLQVWIWPDRGEGATYFPGERIYMNVEVTRDCFLILYDIDTRGNLHILFPYDAWDNNFVAAGDVVRFPRFRDGYEWSVEGPPGIEYVQAIASEFPINPPDWPVYIRSVNHGGAVCPDRELRDFRAGADHLDYIRVVNRKITGRYWDWCATDIASFYVHRRHHNIRVNIDPWPDVFYGEIYIGWPIGGRIYIDDVFIGIAPLWVPRHVHHGLHHIVCYDNNRIVRRQTVHYYPKRDYRHDDKRYRDGAVRTDGNVKVARRGGLEKFRSDGNVPSRDRVSRERPKEAPVKVKTRDETRQPKIRGDFEDSQSKVKVKREKTRVTTGSISTPSKLDQKKESGDKAKRIKNSDKSDKTVTKVAVTKTSTKKSGGLKGLISSVTKSVKKSASKGEAKTASKSASKSEKSAEVKTEASKSESKKISVKKKSSVGSGKRR